MRDRCCGKRSSYRGEETRVLHIIQQLSLGGAGRALIAGAKFSAQLGPFRHKVISLLGPDRRAVRLAQEGGVSVLAMLSPAELHDELAAADIVHFHFWNSPQLREFLEADWPQMRSLLWCHTNCREPPHILTRDLLDRVDFALATTASTLNLLPFRNAPERVALVPGGADFTRLDGFSAKPHPDFTIGHIGTLDFVKLHPDFIAMSAAIAVPSVRFVIAGDGRDRAKLERQVQCADRPERFQFCGYTEDIRPLLETFDVFGYPLAEGNVTTAELILQEVMFAGIPAVVFPYGGAADLVVDNETGLIARDPTEYARMIEHLHAHPAERARLGENAAERARQCYGAHNTASKLNVVYRDLLSKPKRKRPYVSAPGPDGATGRPRIGPFARIQWRGFSCQYDFCRRGVRIRRGSTYCRPCHRSDDGHRSGIPLPLPIRPMAAIVGRTGFDRPWSSGPRGLGIFSIPSARLQALARVLVSCASRAPGRLVCDCRSSA